MKTSVSVCGANNGEDREKRDAYLKLAYEKSIELLSESQCSHGFLASTIDHKNYRAIWGRDGSICAAASFLTEDRKLQEAGLETLRTLAKHQADNGQLPAYLEIGDDGEIKKTVYGGAGEITAIDANLWFIIACHTAEEKLGEQSFLEEPFVSVYRKVLDFLFCIDSNSCGLLEIAVAGDWTDILDRSYHILYDQVLWYRCLKCAAYLARDSGDEERQRRYERAAKRTKLRVNENFWWSSEQHIKDVWKRYMIKDERPEKVSFPYFQTHLEPFSHKWSHRFDAFANTLACVMGIASPEQTDEIVKYVSKHELDQPYPLCVLYPPIEDGDRDATNMRLCDEKPWDYHNGGIWPLAGGFWTILLKKLGRHDEACAALSNVARANEQTCESREDEGWGFSEYHHGKKHKPSGTPFLAWNAAAYIMAYQAVFFDNLACFEKGGDF